MDYLVHFFDSAEKRTSGSSQPQQHYSGQRESDFVNHSTGGACVATIFNYDSSLLRTPPTSSSSLRVLHSLSLLLLPLQLVSFDALCRCSFGLVYDPRRL